MACIKSKCEICNKVFLSKLKLVKHIKEDHNISTTRYYDLVHHTHSVCSKCGAEAYTKTYFSEPKKYCLKDRALFGCQWSKWYWLAKGFSEEEAKKEIVKLQTRNSYNGNKKYSKEILMKEGLSEEEASSIVKWRLQRNPRRKEFYDSDEEFENAMRKFADRQREEFAKNIKGFHSIFSMNFRKYEGLSDEEKRQRIRKTSFCKDNPNISEKTFKEKCNLSLEFYLNKGMSLIEAKEAKLKRHSTFSLKKCIEKYGEEEGRKKFTDRQIRWQESLARNPKNEKILREGRIKGLLFSKSGYSKIATEMFNLILEAVDLSNYHVFFKDPSKNKIEKCVYTESGPRFMDFYIRELNLDIEFDRRILA